MSAAEVDSMETDSASEGKSESPPKRSDNLCCYSLKECNEEKLKGFDFCHKHILEDKASPFKPCDFVSKSSGKKCTNPAGKLPAGQKSYCLIHTRDSELRKALESKTKKKKGKISVSQQEKQDKPTRPGPGRPPGVKNNSKRPKIDIAVTSNIKNEYRRDDVLRVDSSWHGDYESDSESLDNDMDDPLRHAGVWTAEEATKMCRDKLLRLRSLYMSQFERLKHVYKNKKRKFLMSMSANNEGTPAKRPSLPKPSGSLTALHIASRGYNRRYRTDALLQKRSKEKRYGVTTRNQILPQFRCSHYTDGNRCTSRIIPFAVYCLKHIFDDPVQKLFTPCPHKISMNQYCNAPIPNFSNHEKCILHLPRSNDCSVTDLEHELRQAEERQIMKEKQNEENKKASLAKDMGVVASQSVDGKNNVDTKIPVSLESSSSHLSHGTSVDSKPKDLFPVSDRHSTLSQNSNIKPILKKEEEESIVQKRVSNVSSTSKDESISKKSSTMSSKDDLSLKSKSSKSDNALSSSSKMHVKPPYFSSTSQVPSEVSDLGRNESSPDNDSTTRAPSSTKSTMSSDTLVDKDLSSTNKP